MSIAREIGRSAAVYETSVRSLEFVSAIRYLMKARGRPLQARVDAEQAGESERLCEIIKAAAHEGSVDASTWGSALAPYRQAADAWISSLAPYSAFDAILAAGNFYRMPMRTRIAVSSSAAGGVRVIDETSSKPVADLTLAETQLPATKVAGLIAVSNEVLKLTDNAGLDLIAKELRQAVANATDKAFLEAITNVPSGLSGNTTGDFLRDLRTALDAIVIGNLPPRLYLILPAAVIKTLVLQRDAGGWIFPDLTVSGGAIQSIKVTPTSALADTAVLLDSSQCAADSSAIVVDTSIEAMIDMAGGDSPNHSLFSKNEVGVRCDRYMAAKLLRPTGAVTINGLASTL